MRATGGRVAVVGWLLLAACRTGPDVRQGGSDFREGAAAQPAVPVEQLFDVCWPEGASAADAVELQFGDGTTIFTVQGGATNSTGRCIREVADTFPWQQKPATLTVKAPAAPPSGWAVLAFAKLLSAGRFGPERGVLDPAALIAQCLKTGTPLRPKVRFEVRHEPALLVQVFPSSGDPGAFTSAERCVEAVLGATAWPNTRRFLFSLDGPVLAGSTSDDVSMYRPLDGVVAPLDAQRTRDGMTLRQTGVGACWETALNRRAGLSGGRSVRVRVNEQGDVTAAVIAGNESNNPRTAADVLLDRCLIDVVKTARFAPGPAGDGVYSWVFAERTQ